MKVCVTRRQLLAAAGVAALGLCGCLRKEETGAQLPELILRYAGLTKEELTLGAERLRAGIRPQGNFG